MPFGLHSASATFQRVLDQLNGSEMSPLAFAYQDDVIVIGRTLEDRLGDPEAQAISGRLPL